MNLHPLITPLLLLLALTTPLILASSDYQDAVQCALKDPASNSAISAFCAKRNNIPGGLLTDDLHVPSPYASRGRTSTNGQTRASIKGSCRPPQWVPGNYCHAQFHRMCARSLRRKGWARANFGRRGCQEWRLERVRAK